MCESVCTLLEVARRTHGLTHGFEAPYWERRAVVHFSINTLETRRAVYPLIGGFARSSVPDMARRVGLLLLGAAAAEGAFDNFPVKSVNLASADAISFYKLHPVLVEDAHPVYGFEASSGGYIFCGKGLDSEGSSDAEAFPCRLITRLPLPVPVLGHLSCLMCSGGPSCSERSQGSS